MSLSVYLKVKEPVKKKQSSGIFVREGGQTKEISLSEWNKRNPDREPVKFQSDKEETNTVYSANITHNVGTMAAEAGVYEALWRPYKLKEEYNVKLEEDYDIEMAFESAQAIKAKELIEPLRQGLHNLKLNPEKYKKLNPENGWGSYEGLVAFVKVYLNACYEYPDSDVEVSR